MQLSVIEYPERVREAKDYESEVDQVAISHEEKALATELLTSMRQPAIDLDDLRNPRTVRLSSLLEDRVKKDITLKSSRDDSGSNQADDNRIAILDPHSVLICALRAAIGSAERNKHPKKELAEERKNDCKKIG